MSRFLSGEALKKKHSNNLYIQYKDHLKKEMQEEEKE